MYLWSYLILSGGGVRSLLLNFVLYISGGVILLEDSGANLFFSWKDSGDGILLDPGECLLLPGLYLIGSWSVSASFSSTAIRFYGMLTLVAKLF